MAKNLKLHIKNPQLAGAIDLQGLKAKLSKKKEQSSDLEVAEPVPVKKTKKKACEVEPQGNVVAHEVVQETSEAKEPFSAQPELIVKETIQPEPVPVEEAPVFSTLQQEEPIVSVEPIMEAPVIQEVVVPENIKTELKKPKEEKILEKKEEPQVKLEKVAEEKKPFLSALRVNPENLGPVIPKKKPPMPEKKPHDDRDLRRRPFSPDQARGQREPQQKLWEPLKDSNGSRYQTFSAHGRPQGGATRPPFQQQREGGSPSDSRERPPFRGAPGAGGPQGGNWQQRPRGPEGERRPFDGERRPFTGAPGQRPFSSQRPPFIKKESPVGGFQEQPSLAPDDELRRKVPTKDVKEKEKEKDNRTHKKTEVKTFDDTRLRRGLAADKEDEGEIWRKRRSYKSKPAQEIEIVRPKEISVRLPISVKDLAQNMKLKSSQIISKLFLTGVIVTLNDVLDDETVVQLLGEEFGCTVHIDTQEEQRLRITDKSIRDEIKETAADQLVTRPPIVAFMGHVDHGKTSIIDKIRKSNRVQGEVGAITQHIGAFMCPTAHGPITILDTPGHEAFFQMRERGADVTDIVVLVVAGDEGMKEQTIEAMNQAKSSNSTIVVAINKCDRPSYDESNVFRQLAEHNLLPEAWGGQTVTVRCSALTGEGIDSLLEMLALQSEVLELKANPNARARGAIIETEMNKGLGAVATLLVQNGTLHLGDFLVFESSFAKVKSMRDEWGKDVIEAGPSSAVRIHGLSSLPSAGEEFIVVPSERDAREIAEGRLEGKRQSSFQGKRKKTVENMMEQASSVKKKVLNIIVRADVQGSLEALCHAFGKIASDKIDLNIIGTGIGEISESDVQMAIASKAIIIGYHTQVEAHAELMIKEAGVQVRLHNIIYHAVDDVKDLMTNALDKIKEEVYRGKAEVKALFKSSQLGNIAGCMVLDGSIARNSHIRVRRGEECLFEGTISSLKRFKEDVREVSKGTECGIVINNWNDAAPGDLFEAFDISYRAQSL